MDAIERKGARDMVGAMDALGGPRETQSYGRSPFSFCSGEGCGGRVRSTQGGGSREKAAQIAAHDPPVEGVAEPTPARATDERTNLGVRNYSPKQNENMRLMLARRRNAT